MMHLFAEALLLRCLKWLSQSQELCFWNSQPAVQSYVLKESPGCGADLPSFERSKGKICGAFFGALCLRMPIDHDRGQKSAISGRRLHWIFCIFSSGIFLFSPGFLCNLVKKSPQNVEKIARFFWAEKKAHKLVTSVAVMVFFGLEHPLHCKGGICQGLVSKFRLMVFVVPRITGNCSIERVVVLVASVVLVVTATTTLTACLRNFVFISLSLRDPWNEGPFPEGL